MEVVAIIGLISTIVASLEGEGGDVVRRLLGLAERRAKGQALTDDELAYLNEQRERAVARLNEAADAALAQRDRLLNL